MQATIIGKLSKIKAKGVPPKFRFVAEVDGVLVRENRTRPLIDRKREKQPLRYWDNFSSAEKSLKKLFGSELYITQAA